MEWYERKITNKVADKMNSNLNILLLKLEREIKKSMRAGEVSKPGEPPAVQTGTLRRSITSEHDEKHIAGVVGTNEEYGFYLELGTKNIAPRPFLRPALEKNKNNILQVFSKGI